MGLDSAAIKFLSGAKAKGVDFSRMAMIGHQEFMSSAADLKGVLEALGLQGDAHEMVRGQKYGDFFFELLGAKRIDSVDVSHYEDATIIHDMNKPIPDEYRGKFTLVHDGGSLEHIFNVPQALANCMEMVEVGGYFTQVTTANNFMGHGFWQISPELIFRVFSPANGFRVEAVLLNELSGGPWHLVRDPEEMRTRVELCNGLPTYMFCIARRVAVAEIFASAPQQSDYVAAWKQDGSGEHVAMGRPSRFRGLKKYLPHAAQQALRRILKNPYDAHSYRRISEANFLRGQWA